MANKIETVNNGSGLNSNGYNKIESWDSENIKVLSEIYYKVLKLIGEDPDREGLKGTPVRVAKALNYLMMGYSQNPCEIINSAKFREEYRQMVIVKDIDLYSMCETPYASFLRKSSCCLYSQRFYYRLSKIARLLKYSAEDYRFRKG